METTIDLTTCCRTCLRTACNLTSLTADDLDLVTFSFKLVACISEIDWTSDGCAQFICESCIEQLRISYDFRTTCMTTNDALRKSTKQQTSNESESKHDVYDNITSNTEANKDDGLVVEDTNNQGYLELRHFLDSEEELTKTESIIDGNSVSRSSTPESNNFIPDLNQSQVIEIEVQDIQEIIIQDKSDNTPPQTKVILGDGQEYSMQDVEIDNESLVSSEVIIKEIDESNNFIKNKGGVEMMKGPVNTPYGNSQNEKVLGSDQKIPSDLCVMKITKAVQVRPLTPDGKSKKEMNNICNECGKTYKKRANLNVHMRVHTGEKPFECKYCERKFHHSSHLKEHIRRHTGEKPFPCMICSKRFTIRGELTTHMRYHTGEKRFSCTVCDRKCITASDLKVHMRIHTGEKPYGCDYCPKKFSCKYILTSHMKVHTGERPFSCQVCYKSFTQSSHLNVHMRKHTGEKFTCKFCPATFIHSSQLTVHKRVHTGKNPYKCQICDKSCNYASELQSHMAKHSHKKFPCSVCNKQFTGLAYLQEHNRIHTGENLIPCTVCEKTFTRRQFLEKHMRTHTGEKPFSCEVCEKSFTQRSSLRVHMRIHTGERPYSCNICDKAFMTSSDLTSHKKKHKSYLDL